MQWSSMEFNGIHWKSFEFNEIIWNSLEFTGIHLNARECTGIQSNSPESMELNETMEFNKCIGIQWISVEFNAFQWSSIKSDGRTPGVKWNSLEFTKI